MSDPTHELENFGTGGIMVTPLPPSEVRRLGNRRRTRRNSGVAALAVVAVLAAVSPVVLLANRDGSSPPPTGPTSPTPTRAAAPETITYPGQGVFVETAADTAKLTGTTAEFKTFIARLASEANVAGEACPGAAHGITVQKYSTGGYAAGGVNACGGNAALWGIREGTWQEAAGTQDQWDCDSLRFFDIPGSFAGPCGNEAGGFGPTEVNGLTLGMTEAEITRAGGSVKAGPADQCRTVVLPYEGTQKDKTSAVFSPTQGLAGIFARSGMMTPEGIGLGSTTADVKKAYPDGQLSNGYWVAPLAGSHRYEFGLGNQGFVVEMVLTTNNQDCFG